MKEIKKLRYLNSITDSGSHQQHAEKLLKRTSTFIEHNYKRGKSEIKTTSPQPEKRERHSKLLLEKAVMSRRPAFELSDNEDDFL